MPALDNERATELLARLFAEAETAFLNRQPPSATPRIADAIAALFASGTQSYREALLGCGLARLLDASINVRRIYINQGADAFNGRTLDERAVNPFLHERMIPCSKGPYLAVFRRNVELRPETASGLRDKKGYAAMLEVVEALESCKTSEARRIVLSLVRLRCDARFGNRPAIAYQSSQPRTIRRPPGKLARRSKRRTDSGASCRSDASHNQGVLLA